MTANDGDRYVQPLVFDGAIFHAVTCLEMAIAS